TRFSRDWSSDVCSSDLILAAKPRDANHPYGHGKVEFISAAIEGALIIIAGLMISYQAVYHFLRPQPLRSLDLGIALIALTGIVKIGRASCREGGSECMV